jgi:hypothetical protein
MMLHYEYFKIVTDVSEALRSFETPVIVYQSKQRNIQYALNLQQHRCEILISAMYTIIHLYQLELFSITSSKHIFSN